MPEIEPMLKAVPEALHVPPVVPSISEIVAPPAQTTESPVMGDGKGFIVTILVVLQPDPRV